MAKYHVAVVGGRDFQDRDEMFEYLDTLLSITNRYLQIVIVSGGARGADTLAAEYARERAYKLIEYPADWNRYGKSAGYKRNKQIVDKADMVVAFWDGKSRGTKHSIDLAMAADKYTEIVYY